MSLPQLFNKSKANTEQWNADYQIVWAYLSWRILLQKWLDYITNIAQHKQFIHIPLWQQLNTGKRKIDINIGRRAKKWTLVEKYDNLIRCGRKNYCRLIFSLLNFSMFLRIFSRFHNVEHRLLYKWTMHSKSSSIATNPNTIKNKVNW